MKKTAVFLIVLFSTIAFSHPGSNHGKSSDNSTPFKQLVPIALSILKGDNSAEIRENISPEAYILDNNSYESLFEVLNNLEKRQKLEEGNEIHPEFYRIMGSDDRTNALLILETKTNDNTKTYWHSIYFEIGKSNKWQIMSWHKS